MEQLALQYAEAIFDMHNSKPDLWQAVAAQCNGSN
jgi:hypothetical protein